MKLLALFYHCSIVSAGVETELKSSSISLDYAQVDYVTASQKMDGIWCFDSLVRHNYEGWEHYVDGWDVLDLDDVQLGYRLLGHPHIKEQPFTRSQCKVQVPTAISKVVVRTKCNKLDFGGKPIVVGLNASKREVYLVCRNN